MKEEELKKELDEIDKGIREEMEKIIVLLEENLTGQERFYILDKACGYGSNILLLCKELKSIKNRVEKKR